MKKKKLIQLLLIILISVPFLAGCSNDASQEKNETISILELEKQMKQNVAESAKKEQEKINKAMGKEFNLEYAKKYSGAVLKTNYGNIEVKLFGEDSPKTVSNFLELADTGFYNETKFHRVIPDFMIQGGDPNSKDDDWSNDGMGDPGYKFEDEFNKHVLVRGSLAMANSGPNTNGSQFFIVTADSTPWLDGKHTNFGEVVSGMEIVTKIEAVKTNENDHPIEDVVIEEISLKP